MGEEASGGRVASPRNAARSEPLFVSGTRAAQRPSGPQTASATCANVAPGTANWIWSGAPAGEEPSGKRSSPESWTGRVRMRRLAARTVMPGQRARVARGARAQVGELGVERLARAGGRVAVAVAADALERHRRPARIAVGRPAARGHHDLALRRHGVQRELPADQPRQRVHPRLGVRHGGERPDRRDAGRGRVVALRLRADHGLVDPARAALEHLAVLVDEEVVADVVPAVGVAVVARDAEHDAGRLLRPVVVRADRVVDERGLHLAVLAARSAAARSRRPTRCG